MRRIGFALALAAACPALAEDAAASGRRASRPDRPDWEFALTAYPTKPRGAEATTSFSGGDALKWEITPIAGGAWGPLHAAIPGFEASLAWGELGFRASDAVRIGAVGQRTRAYGNARDFQRGPFAQIACRRATLGAYGFNPGSSAQIFVASIGLSF